MEQQQLNNQEPANKPAQVDKKLVQEKILGQFTQYDINTLKSTIANGLNSAEFGLFLNTCVATGLNPFLKQVIPVVYESEKNGRRFDIQVPVEGIEHLARQKEGWLGYDLQLVCENDEFKVKRDKESGNWIIEQHDFSFPRGRTMGAYCIVPRQGFKEVVIFMEVTEVNHLLEDYRTKKMWAKWFNDMFKKHVKKRALREQFGIEIDDMSDLNAGPEKHDNNIPAYNQQPQRQEISQEDEGPDLDELLQEQWDKISSLMEQYGFSDKEAEAICKAKLYAPPAELKPQQVAAFAKYLELEGHAKKAREQKEAKQAASYQHREGAAQEVAEHEQQAQDEEKQPEPIQEAQEAPKEPEKPKSELDAFAEELDGLFAPDGQGELNI
jgi:recombination protein RecT